MLKLFIDFENDLNRLYIDTQKHCLKCSYVVNLVQIVLLDKIRKRFANLILQRHRNTWVLVK